MARQSSQQRILSKLQRSPAITCVPYDSKYKSHFKRLNLQWIKEFFRIDPAMDRKTVRAIGSMALAMLIGVMAQWLVDAEGAPTADELFAAAAGIWLRSARSFAK